MTGQLTHLNEKGHARMVDISDKDSTRREAVAEAWVLMQPETLAAIVEGGVAKGDVLATARIAGIQAAKKCSDLIPLCHPLQLSAVQVDLLPCAPQAGQPAMLRIEARCRLNGRTGVEMEALTAASVTALTIYDMCKALEKGMQITGIRLLEKTGGKSGDFRAVPTAVEG